MKALDGLQDDGPERAARGASRARAGACMGAAIRFREKLARAAAAPFTNLLTPKRKSLQCAAVSAEERASWRGLAVPEQVALHHGWAHPVGHSAVHEIPQHDPGLPGQGGSGELTSGRGVRSET